MERRESYKVSKISISCYQFWSLNDSSSALILGPTVLFGKFTMFDLGKMPLRCSIASGSLTFRSCVRGLPASESAKREEPLIIGILIHVVEFSS